MILLPVIIIPLPPPLRLQSLRNIMIIRHQFHPILLPVNHLNLIIQSRPKLNPIPLMIQLDRLLPNQVTPLAAHVVVDDLHSEARMLLDRPVQKLAQVQIVGL